MNNRKELCPQGEKLLECRTYDEALALYRQILATIADQDAHAALNWYLSEAKDRIDAADVRNMKVGKNCKYKLDLKGPDPDDMIERTASRRKPYHDHHGNEYPSIREMCKHYGISDKCFRSRMATGWSVEKALTKSRHCGNPGKPIKDHLGNEYPNIGMMCAAWGITRRAFIYAKSKGLPLEECLKKSRVAPITSGGSLRTRLKCADIGDSVLTPTIAENSANGRWKRS